MQNHRLSRQGFTLVELSIVLVIIGLLIGGILVGQSMVDTAKVNKVITEIKQYKIMAELFKERFRKYPGDFNMALISFGGCNNIEANCNGNGDGAIIQTGVPNAGRNEPIYFWHHLYLTGFLKTPYGAAFAGGTAVGAPGLHVPKLSSYHDKAGLIITHGTQTQPALENLEYFVIGGSFEDHYQYPWLRPGIVRPKDAMMLDAKLDDGIPNAGSVRSFNASSNVLDELRCFVGLGSTATASRYDLRHDDYVNGCHVKIKFKDLF